MKKYTPIKFLFLLGAFLVLTAGLKAQTVYDFPAGDYWSLDAGFGMSGILANGSSYQAVIDPKLWLSPPLMVGAKIGLNFSAEKNNSLRLGNILTFEGQVYIRWNFLRLGKQEKPFNIFAQIGLGLLASYRGYSNVFDDVTKTRGSIMGDVAIGVTIPLGERWHLEPNIRGGYPHIFGFSLTAGYKFRLPRKTVEKTVFQERDRIEFIQTIRTVPANEIVSRVMVSGVEYILFGPDIGRYNVGIDADAQQLNELVLNYVAETLKSNPECRVRIEGHANPYTINISEIDELQVLSAMRSNVVAEQLRSRGVSNDQLVIISFGGTRTATSDWDARNRNRRVEMILIQVDTN